MRARRPILWNEGRPSSVRALDETEIEGSLALSAAAVAAAEIPQILFRHSEQDT